MTKELRQELENVVYGYISRELDVEYDSIKPDAHIVKELGADSLDLTEMVMFMEDKYNLSITDDKASELYTPKRVVDYLMKNVRGDYQ